MDWSKYSWRAIRCCVSKGMLIVLAIASVIGAGALRLHHSSQQRVARVQRCSQFQFRIARTIEQHERQTCRMDPTGALDCVLAISDEGRALLEQYRREYDDECVTRRPAFLTAIDNAFERAASIIPSGIREAIHDAIGPILVAIAAFCVAAFLLSMICADQISFCQVAVDTGRSPLYWLPERWGGNPLPPRQQVTCDECGNARAETESEYRTRLELPPLPGDDVVDEDDTEYDDDPRPLDEWSEEDGDVLWWKFPVDEPPYVGSPLDTKWPGVHTHWTPIVVPDDPTEAT